MGFTKAFDVSEFQARVARVKERMQAAGFDMILCQDPANMSYLTGFDGWSFYTPQAVVVHLEEPWPIWNPIPVSWRSWSASNRRGVLRVFWDFL